MLRHKGGEQVKSGFYFNIESWEVTTVSGFEGGTLAGDERTVYLRMPALAMLLFAPIMGALFAVFLPFIGIYLVVRHFSAKAWTQVRALGHVIVAALGPAWQPGTAHLTGTPESEKPATGEERSTPAQERLTELEKEIEKKQGR